ncbi:MFS transporter [Clostridium sp. DJ247]|uniref:MFS transporter n=1 Tax=Clostridium sp. DJ247 TaxID=2726188 RepID=UPI001628F9EE|nr:MFS transporter [Clostridium sp. DJ247]
MRKLKNTEKSWVLYDLANSAYSMTVTSTILPLYFKSVFANTGGSSALSTAYWGYSNSIGTLIVAILAPILGTLADYKGYKKRFFNVFFIMGITTTAMLALVPTKFWLMLLIVYVLSSIGFSGSCIFYDAFLVDVTTEDRMDYVSSMGFAIGYIGSTIPFILCMAIVMLAQFNIIPLSVTTASIITFVITAVWWGVFTLPLIRKVNQVHGIEIEAAPIKNSFSRLGRTFKNIKMHKQIFLFLLAYFFYIDGVNTIITMATSYGSDLGISTTSLLLILLVTQFVAFPCSIIFGKLAEKYTGKRMLLIAVLIYSGICIYAFFIKTSFDFWVLAMLVATSQGGIQAISRSYYGKLIPKNNSNEFFGFYNIFGRFAAIIGPFLVGIVTQITGKTNYGVFSIIVLFIIGGLVLINVQNDHEKIIKKV